MPAAWFRSADPARVEAARRTGKLKLEIVCHCWRYAHYLTYQLSTLVNYRTDKLEVTMTVYHAREDEAVRGVLDFFGDIDVPGVTWNWQELPKEHLFSPEHRPQSCREVDGGGLDLVYGLRHPVSSRLFGWPR